MSYFIDTACFDELTDMSSALVIVQVFVSIVIYVGLFILVLLLQFWIMVNVILYIVTFIHTIIILVHLIYVHTSKTLGTNMSHVISFLIWALGFVVAGYP